MEFAIATNSRLNDTVLRRSIVRRLALTRQERVVLSVNRNRACPIVAKNGAILL